jgi:hypothetical protein
MFDVADAFPFGIVSCVDVAFPFGVELCDLADERSSSDDFAEENASRDAVFAGNPNGVSKVDRTDVFNVGFFDDCHPITRANTC